MSAVAAYVRARTVVHKAAELMGIDEMDITSDERDPLLSEIRFAIMQVLSDEGYSMALIGKIMLRDHSTVRHGLKRAKHLSGDSYFSGFVEALR